LANIDDMQQGKSMESLPKTFHNAVSSREDLAYDFFELIPCA